MAPNRDHNRFQSSRRDNNPAHAMRKPPSSEDFFTDSLLESSRIPTPSPSKNSTKSIFPSKPRRAIGNTRTLRAAWDATAGSARPSSSASDFNTMQENLKPTPFQARAQNTVNPAKSKATPSPPRGRQTALPLASPTSDASSPPGGLNDVYQRIADEERLAAQEGEVEEEDFTDSTMSYDDYADEDRARLNRIRSSQSPLHFRTSSRNTPQPQAADANKENQNEETGATDASGMSFLENMTDQVLAAKLTPHTQDRARDRARLDKAIQKTTPLAFSKAQVGSKHALTSENLQRSGRRGNSGSVHSSSNGSLRNDDTTPPPNVPRNWGTKGRVDKDWLRKIHNRNGSPANGSTNGDKHESSQVDWTAAAAEVPLPSVEDSLTPRPEHSTNPTPASLSQQTSLDRIRQWELNDFTTNNLSMSNSPPVRVRTNIPDHVRDREIETLEKRAVTTNRLGEIIKKNSTEFLAGKIRTPSVGARNGVGDQPSPEKNEEIPKIEEEGEPIPDTPIVVFKGSSNGIKKDESARHRPLHDRKDSRDSLQRLARAMSESPRPSSTPEDWSLIKEEEAESVTPVIRKSDDTLVESRRSSKEVADVNHTSPVKRSRSADAARTPIVTGAWTDTILPDTIKSIKQRHAPSKYSQTPHVTGGWIDTPVVAGQRQSSALAPIPMVELSENPTVRPSKEDSNAPQQPNPDTKPASKPAQTLPRSALTNLLTKAKRKLATTDDEDHHNDTLNLGDATISSLEDLLTLDNADMTTLLRMGAAYDAHSSPHPHPTSDPDPGLGTETELLERLGTKLERLRTNIHDARKGISKLELQVSQPSPGPDVADPRPCQSCGCPRRGGAGPLFSFPYLSSSADPSSAWISTLRLPRLSIPVPKLWNPPKSNSGGGNYYSGFWTHIPRPTPLGYLALAIWLWSLSESLLCARYCKPEFAEYYVFRDEPGRGGGWRWGRLVWGFWGSAWGDWGWLGRVGFVVLRAVLRWLGMLAGWTDGFFGEAVGGGSRSEGWGAVRGADAYGVGNEAGVWGLGEDEFL